MSNIRLLISLLSLISTAVMASGSAIQFQDVTAVAGINQSHAVTGSYFITGQAWGDYDGDGWLDLFLTDINGSNTLYHNQHNGTFAVSPLSPQVALANRQSGGAVFVDYNNDRLLDLLVMNFGTDVLFMNTGSGFVDVTAAVGLDQHVGRGESAAWADFNGDGFLDVYIVNWYYNLETDPERRDYLYMSQGAQQFVDVSSSLNSDRIAGPGFAVTFLDYDNDGDQDLYVVNDKLFGNLLWRNDGPGCGHWCFTDVSISSGAHRPVYGMGIGVSDYDMDGDWDMYFTSIAEMVLMENRIAQGQAEFVEVTGQAGVNLDATGWGTFFADMDNDGLEDLYLATVDMPADSSNRVFHNLGSGQFADLSMASGGSDNGTSIGVAYADYDRDGKVDFILGNHNQGYKLYRNTTSNTNHWLHIEVAGDVQFNAAAIGTRVRLVLDDGTELMRYKEAGASIGSNHQPGLHFGLGQRLPVRADITWPNGVTTQQPVSTHNASLSFQYVQAEELLLDGFETID